MSTGTLLAFRGLCPRDYSKFKDLQGLRFNVGKKQVPVGVAQSPTPSVPRPGHGPISWTQREKELGMLGFC